MKSPTLFAIGIALIVGFSLSFLIPDLRPHRALVPEVAGSRAPDSAGPVENEPKPPAPIEAEFENPIPTTIAEFAKNVRQSVPPSWNEFLAGKLVGRERDSARLNDPRTFEGLVSGPTGFRQAELTQVPGDNSWNFCIELNQCWNGRPVVEYGKSNIWTLYYPNGLRLYMNYMSVEMEDGYTEVRVLTGWLLKVGSAQPAARVAFVARIEGAPVIDANLIARFLPDPRVAAR